MNTANPPAPAVANISTPTTGAKMTTTTGWPPGLLQDDSRELSSWWARK